MKNNDYLCTSKFWVMNKYIKLVIAALMVIAGIYLMFNREIGWGIVLMFLVVLPVVLFFRNEYVLLALWKVRDQKLDQASQWLSRITDYKTQLHRSQYGYYHYLMGLTLSEQPIQSEPYMKKALEYGLSMKHDRALVMFNLAAVALSKGKKTEAQKYLNDAKKLDTAGLLTEHLNRMKEHLKMPNMQKHLHNPQMRNRGKYF